MLEHTTLAYELLKMRKSLFCEDGGEILISLLRAYLEALISSWLFEVEVMKAVLYGDADELGA